MNNGTRGLGTPPPGPGRKSPCLLVSAVWTRRNPSPEPAAGVRSIPPSPWLPDWNWYFRLASVQCPPLELFHVLCFGHPAENINIKCQYTHLYLQYLIVATTFTSTLHLLHVFYCLQNRKQHLATSRQQIGVQRLLIRNLKVLLCCWCCDHGVPVPASSLGLSSPSLRSPSLNIPRPPTLNFPNLKSISVWKSTINFIFPRYIMPHFFCQYKRKRKYLLKHYFSSPSMECRYYLLCHFRKNVSVQWYSLNILKLIVLVSAWVGALWYYLSNYIPTDYWCDAW